MAFRPDTRTYPAAPGVAQAGALDAGLRAYMLHVYNWMTSGLVLTGIVAALVSSVPAVHDAFYQVGQNQFGRLVMRPTLLGYAAMFAPLGFVLVLSMGVNRLSRQSAQALYWAFCAAMGASLSNIFWTYTGDSITRVFFITAGTFAVMSAWGYTTKTDLSRFGSFLMMGLVGVILASVVNMFVGSSQLQFLVSIVGVLVFTGLTAFDTQRIKASYLQYSYAEGSDVAAKRSVYDALSLYLNFINLFMLLLQLTGNRSSNN